MAAEKGWNIAQVASKTTMKLPTAHAGWRHSCRRTGPWSMRSVHTSAAGNTPNQARCRNSAGPSSAWVSAGSVCSTLTIIPGLMSAP